MDKKPLIGVSILAVVLLVLGSLSNVVGYQTVQTSQQNLIKGSINQGELLFQTIVDIANNKEVQRIILKSQMSRGIFPTSEFPIVTKNQLKMMYFMGLIFSKIISKPRIHSMIQQYQSLNPITQEEINDVIEKNMTLRSEITNLQNSECDCENDSAINWSFPVLCTILFFILLPVFLPVWLLGSSIALFGALIFGKNFDSETGFGLFLFWLGFAMMVVGVAVAWAPLLIGEIIGPTFNCWWYWD